MSWNICTWLCFVVWKIYALSINLFEMDDCCLFSIQIFKSNVFLSKFSTVKLFFKQSEILSNMYQQQYTIPEVNQQLQTRFKCPSRQMTVISKTHVQFSSDILGVHALFNRVSVPWLFSCHLPLTLSTWWKRSRL